MFQRVEISDLQLNGIERWFRDGFLIFGRFSMEEKVYLTPIEPQRSIVSPVGRCIDGDIFQAGITSIALNSSAFLNVLVNHVLERSGCYIGDHPEL